MRPGLSASPAATTRQKPPWKGGEEASTEIERLKERRRMEAAPAGGDRRVPTVPNR